MTKIHSTNRRHRRRQEPLVRFITETVDGEIERYRLFPALARVWETSDGGLVTRWETGRGGRMVRFSPKRPMDLLCP